LKELLYEGFEDSKVSIKKYISDLTCKLVRQKTVNVPVSQLPAYPYMDVPGQEERVTAILAEECARHKITHKIYERDEHRPNLVFSVGKGRKKLIVACHTDVTPPGNGWKTNPFEPVVKGGVITGRGALDNKGPLAACLAAAIALKPMERDLKGQLVVVAFADQSVVPAKADSDCGLDHLLSEGLIKAEFAIIPDVGKELRAIGVAEKGRILLRIRCHGTQVHGALPEKGDNAIMRMVRLLKRISTLTLPYKPHELLGRPTLNVGEIHGGSCPSMVPAECEVSLDIRYLPGQASEAIVDEIKKLSAEIGGSFEFIVDSDTKPCQVDPDNILVRSIQENTLALLGYEANLTGTGISSAARKMARAGALAVGFGPGNDAVLDSANESVDVEQLYNFARIVGGVIVDLFT